MKHNPDWKIMFYYPKLITKSKTWESFENKHETNYTDFTKELFKLPISKTCIDFKKYGFSNSASEVHKSDFLRWNLLASMGGLWSDMDILYFKPITNLFINVPENSHKDTVVCISEYGHSIGFMMSSYQNDYFNEISIARLSNFKKNSYQCIGSELCNAKYPSLEDIPGNPVNLGMEAVYSYDANRIDQIYEITAVSDIKMISNAIGLHWYAGHPLSGKFLNETNGGLKISTFNLLDFLIP